MIYFVNVLQCTCESSIKGLVRGDFEARVREKEGKNMVETPPNVLSDNLNLFMLAFFDLYTERGTVNMHTHTCTCTCTLGLLRTNF